MRCVHCGAWKELMDATRRAVFAYEGNWDKPELLPCCFARIDGGDYFLFQGIPVKNEELKRAGK